MPIDLSLVKTIVVVMMENRSFDNLLGYLNLGPNKRTNVEGLSDSAAWLDKFASVYQGIKYRPFLLTDPYDAIDADPPHERDQIARQHGGFFDHVSPPVLRTDPPPGAHYRMGTRWGGERRGRREKRSAVSGRLRYRWIAFDGGGF